MKSIYLQLFEYSNDGPLPVVATVVSTSGSTPQVPGSSALFNGEGLVSGTIGGGVVEKRIQEIASESFLNRKSGYYNFNLANDISRKEEAICGGQITILVDGNTAKHLDVFKKISNAISRREPCLLLTIISVENGETIIARHYADNSISPELPPEILHKAEPVIKRMLLDADPAGYCAIGLGKEKGHGSYLFIESVYPPLKLIIAGAGHIGRALAHLGKLTGFEVTVVDDRQEYANPDNIPDAAHFIAGNVGETLRNIEKGSDTYIVIVTRGHADDAAALKSCLGTDAAYLGMIGSRKKTTSMRDEFILKGWTTKNEWEKLHTPIGIEINARTVEEIAISIAAELIKVKNNSKDKLKGCPA